MVKLFLANSLAFDFKKNVYKADIIFSSPPIYQKDNDTFGDVKEVHVGVVYTFFKSLHAILKPRVTVVLMAKDCYLSNLGKNWKPKLVKHGFQRMEFPSGSNWQALSEKDIWSLVSRFNMFKYESILDPFCGTASLLKAFQIVVSKGSIYGVDISKDQIKIAASKFERCDVLDSNGLEM